MFELVPSKYTRDYFQKVGFTFTDFQKADLRVKNGSGFNPYFVSDWEIPKIVDYSGESVATLYLDAEGRIRHLWSHEHINPMYLAVESVPDAPGDERQQAYKKAMGGRSNENILHVGHSRPYR